MFLIVVDYDRCDVVKYDSTTKVCYHIASKHVHYKP